MQLCFLPRPLRLLWRLTMPGYDNPNRPEWTGKRKAKNFARINAACPVCGCPRTSRQKTKPPLLD